MEVERSWPFFQEINQESGGKQEDSEPDERTEIEKRLDSKYWFQDQLILAQELGISKKAFLEDYYPDEIILLFRRKGEIEKRRIQKMDKDKKPNEKVEEVYWDQMGI